MRLRRVVHRLISMTSFDRNFNADHFALLALPRTQRMDRAALEACFRELQAQVHPDKYAHGSDGDKRQALQWATRVNEAYQTLKDPLRRARYLLQLLGYDPKVDSNTAMANDFLVVQMELREQVDMARDAGDEETLEAAHEQVSSEIDAQHRTLIALLDEQKDYVQATVVVRQLMFQEKLRFEIDEALEAVAQ
ncbi:MAG TPA: Fe-S protein assembly co-chaperone HscB [Rhodocyclaceae bacterium]|nr:Fe-S protein assembly co-chaperone HscB [Rhodocyclaceae bacterium]